MGSQCSGGWAEQQALQQLEAQGWRLLDRNWHCRWGELDLVLERQQQLLVVRCCPGELQNPRAFLCRKRWCFFDQNRRWID